MKLAALLVVSTLAAAPALAQTTVPAPAGPASLPAEAAPAQLQQPSPAAAKAAEAALRKVIDEFRADKPDYTTMTDELRDRITPKADQVHNLLTGLGDIKSVTVVGLMPDAASGTIFFRVIFANASIDWLIQLAPDGKLSALALRTTPVSD
jgi:hypothetical protein